MTLEQLLATWREQDAARDYSTNAYANGKIKRLMSHRTNELASALAAQTEWKTQECDGWPVDCGHPECVLADRCRNADQMSSDIRTPQSPSGVWTEEEWEAAKKRAAERAKSFGIEPLSPSGSAGWRTIESAPKDGTQVWAWDDARGANPAMYIADVERWLITYDDAEITPTFWQPIPPPPDGAQSNRGSDEQKHPDNSTVETTQEPKRWTYTGYDLPPFVGPPSGGSPDGD